MWAEAEGERQLARGCFAIDGGCLSPLFGKFASGFLADADHREESRGVEEVHGHHRAQAVRGLHDERAGRACEHGAEKRRSGVKGKDDVVEAVVALLSPAEGFAEGRLVGFEGRFVAGV